MIELPEHITVKMGDAIYLIPRQAAKLAVWNRVPDMLKDPESPDAKNPDNQLIRLALKAGLRPFVPKILARMFGEHAPQVPPRVDLLKWLSSLIVNVVVDQLSMHEWVINAEQCDTCKDPVYYLRGVSSNPVHKQTGV